MKQFAISFFASILLFIAFTSTTHAASTLPCGAYGDADHNNQITDNDAVLILNTVAGLYNPSAQDRLLMDVDYDGGVTSVDSLYIRNYIAGNISTFPACASKPSPCWTKGDVNYDGKVSKADSDHILLYVLRLAAIRNIYNADVNADGKADAVDSLLITRYVKGLDTTFPACTTRR